jgi:nucleoside-triphosphatase THEP1
MELIPFKPLRTVWLKAAVAGSLWASIEIILGSFLHNLSFPLSGTVLSFTGVYLMVSFMQVWKDKGLIWRAGLICALMKSISPSAIILGPMIGILTEALLLEMAVRLIGRNLIGYMLGGAMAVFSTLIQKVVSLVIMYGFDFVSILAALYKFSLKQINTGPVDPLYLVCVIAGIYLVTGMIAGFLGYRSGRGYLKKRQDLISPSEIIMKPGEHSFAPAVKQEYSLLLLAVNICAMVLSLTLLNYELFLPAILFSCSYLAFCFIRYKSSLRRLKKISIWIQFILLTLIATFLWNGISTNSYFTLDGFVVGLKMIFRAVIIMTGFAAVSVELKNPVIRSVSYEKGFASLYQSLGLAFAALPGIIAILPKPERRKKRVHFSVSLILKQAEIMLQQFEKEHTSRSQVIIITGEIGEGKTTFVSKVVEALEGKGYTSGGFLAIGVHSNGKRTGFDLLELQFSRRIELCRDTPFENGVQFGHYYFSPGGLAEGNAVLKGAYHSGRHFVVIDEVGPMEMNNQGWGETIRQLCRSGGLPQLWIVRKSLVEKAARKWNVGNVYVFDISKDPLAEVIGKTMEILGEPAVTTAI